MSVDDWKESDTTETIERLVEYNATFEVSFMARNFSHIHLISLL
jgi:hypothetical protein